MTDWQNARRHIPVLLPEVVEFLSPKKGGWYLDGTLGLGGHSEAILDAAGADAHLMGLDRDACALSLAGERLARFGSNVCMEHSKYSDFAAVLDAHGWPLLDGVLIDIGVSSMQIDTPERGFSFVHDGPLDMRMNPKSGDAPASVIVNRGSFETLKRIIFEFGEEPLAGRIARAIVDARVKSPIESTSELAAVVAQAYPAKWRATARNHPATRTFQALRIAVNKELEELDYFLGRIADRLKPGARVAVITFHSLEDRMVKNAFREAATPCVCPPHIPTCVCGHKQTLKILTRKPVVPSPEETAVNPRAASAKLRVAERL